jgi:hypothetical protein
MAHQPEWCWEPCEVCGDEPQEKEWCVFGFWFDLNQLDSDQFGGTVEEWVGVLAEEGIHPPAHPPSKQLVNGAWK